MTDVLDQVSLLDPALMQQRVNEALTAGGVTVNAPATPAAGQQSTTVHLDYGITLITSTAGGSVSLPNAVAGKFLFLALMTGNPDAQVNVWTKLGSGDKIDNTPNDFPDFFMWASSYNGIAAPFLVFTCTTDGVWNCNLQNQLD